MSRMSNSVSASVETNSTTSAPSITADPLIPPLPSVGQELEIDGATASGSPTPLLIHTFYRGDPAGSGVLVGNRNNLSYQVSKDDFGSVIFVRSDAKNGVGSDDTSDTSSDVVGWTKTELWEAGNLNDYTEDDTIGSRFTADATAPSGTLLEMWGGVRATLRDDTSEALDAVNAPNKSDVYVYLKTPASATLSNILIRWEDGTPTNNGGSAGVLFKNTGQVNHILPGESELHDANYIRIHNEDTEYLVRIITEDDISIVKVWNPADPEPESGGSGYSSRQHTGTLDQKGFKFAIRSGTTSSNTLKIYSWSIGMNADAPEPGIAIEVAAASDPLEYAAPTSQTFVDVMDGTFTFNVEEDV